MDPESTSRVSPAGRYWIARVLQRDSKDALASLQLVGQLLSWQSVEPVYIAFDKAMVDALKEACREHRRIGCLIDNVNALEAYRPVQATRAHYRHYWSTSVLFSEHYPTKSAGIRHAGGYWLNNEAFLPDHKDFSLFLITEFSRWIQSGILMHEPTQTLLGGPNGFKWAVIQLVRYCYTLDQLIHNHSPPVDSVYRPNLQELKQGTSACLIWLSDCVTESIEILSQLHDLPTDEVPESPQPTEAEQMKRHDPGPMLMAPATRKKTRLVPGTVRSPDNTSDMPESEEEQSRPTVKSKLQSPSSRSTIVITTDSDAEMADGAAAQALTSTRTAEGGLEPASDPPFLGLPPSDSLDEDYDPGTQLSSEQTTSEDDMSVDGSSGSCSADEHAFEEFLVDINAMVDIVWYEVPFDRIQLLQRLPFLCKQFVEIVTAAGNVDMATVLFGITSDSHPFVNGQYNDHLKEWYTSDEGQACSDAMKQWYLKQNVHELLKPEHHNGLPVYNPNSPYNPFPAPIAEIVQQYMTTKPELQQLVQLTIQMEQFGPLHTTGIFNQTISPSQKICILPDKPLTDEQVAEFIKEPLQPLFFDPGQPGHRGYSISLLQTQLECDPFLNTQNQVLFGGSGGFRYVVFIVCCVLESLATMAESNTTQTRLSPPAIHSYLTSILNYAVNCLKDSIDRIKTSAKHRSVASVTTIRFDEMLTPERSRKALAIAPPANSRFEDEHPAYDDVGSRLRSGASRSLSHQTSKESHLEQSMPLKRNKRSADVLQQPSTTTRTLLVPYRTSEPSASQPQERDDSASALDKTPKRRKVTKAMTGKKTVLKAEPKGRSNATPEIDEPKPIDKDNIEVVDEKVEKVPKSKEQQSTRVKRQPSKKGKASTAQPPPIEDVDAPRRTRSQSVTPSLTQPPSAPGSQFAISDNEGDDEEQDNTSFRVPAQRTDLFTCMSSVRPSISFGAGQAGSAPARGVAAGPSQLVIRGQSSEPATLTAKSAKTSNCGWKMY
ncbi:hypothetical protein RhiJN_01892 [Ceratobasidium sp. AG-Ba]|nr:hypothetical protein RhiJN_01892 [Ceratobasidium sp. AG-Ba]